MSSNWGSVRIRTWKGLPRASWAREASRHRSSFVHPFEPERAGSTVPSHTRPFTLGESSNLHFHDAATRNARTSDQRTSATRRIRSARMRAGGSGGVRVRRGRGSGRGRRDGERIMGEETILCGRGGALVGGVLLREERRRGRRGWRPQDGRLRPTHLFILEAYPAVLRVSRPVRASPAPLVASVASRQRRARPALSRLPAAAGLSEACIEGVLIESCPCKPAYRVCRAGDERVG